MVCINWANALGSFHSKQHYLLHVLIFGHVQSVAIYVLCCWPYLLPFYYCILGIFLKFDLFRVCSKEKYGISNEIKLLVFQFRTWKKHCLFCPGNFWPWFGRTEMRASVLSCILWTWENSQLWAWAVPPTSTPRYILQSIQFISYFFPLSLGFVTL